MQTSFLSPEDRNFIRRVVNVPNLSREEEKLYATAWRDHRDERARDKLVLAHYKLVVRMAAKYKRYGLPALDLMEEGIVGLLRAVDHFEPERNLRLSTLAAYWIRAKILEYIMRNTSIVNNSISSEQKCLFFKLRRLKAELTENSGADLTSRQVAIVAASLGVSENAVRDMEQHQRGGDISLNTRIGDDDSSPERQDMLIEHSPNPEELFVDQQEHSMRRQMLIAGMEVAGLGGRERDILHSRRFLQKPATLDALGEKHGLSKQRVRQIEARAFEKLQKAVRELAALPPDQQQRFLRQKQQLLLL